MNDPYYEDDHDNEEDKCDFVGPFLLGMLAASLLCIILPVLSAHVQIIFH